MKALKNLGIIGGLGPMASVYFMELIENRTRVEKDQEHLRITMMSIPDTPDRTAYILDNSRENPLPSMVKAGLDLKSIGADYIAIPCVTAHYFHDKLCQEIGLPIIYLPGELAAFLKKNDIATVGLMATTGTVKSGFVQSELQKNGIDTVLPSEADQEIVMRVIYEQIKAGKTPNVTEFTAVGDRLMEEGAQALILGCTELSLIKKAFSQSLSDRYIDVLEILADAAIRDSGIGLKE